MSSPTPGWLRPPLTLSPWGADTYDTLYEVFKRDLKSGQLRYLGNNVWFYPDTEDEGKETIFWHLTTREDRDNPPERLPDLRRCERLHWIRLLIERCPDGDGHILDWDHEEGNGTVKTYIWLQHHDFLIVLKKLPNGRRRLITSFHLDNQHQRDKTRKKYERRLPR